MFGNLTPYVIPVGLGILVAFLLCFLLAPAILPPLRRLKLGQTVRDDGPSSHLQKNGVPTMGGVVFFVAVTLGAALPLAFMSPSSWPLACIALLYAFGNGLVGFADDFIKVAKKRSLGLNARQKLVWQIVLSVGLAVYGYFSTLGPVFYLPWGGQWNLGVWYIPLMAFVGVGFTNASNLLDGLDGLCASVSSVVMAAMALIIAALSAMANAAGDTLLAQQYLGLAVVTGAAAGCSLAFLRVNAHPAQLFMGDTGSMFLGGMLVAVYALSGMTLLLPLMGGLYLVTALSVMLQVFFYKWKKKRIFRMAPLHHHFELKGYSETYIVAVYTALAVVLCLAALVIVSL